jgi:hypothetical protein
VFPLIDVGFLTKAGFFYIQTNRFKKKFCEAALRLKSNSHTLLPDQKLEESVHDYTGRCTEQSTKSRQKTHYEDENERNSKVILSAGGTEHFGDVLHRGIAPRTLQGIREKQVHGESRAQRKQSSQYSTDNDCLLQTPVTHAAPLFLSLVLMKDYAVLFQDLPGLAGP